VPLDRRRSAFERAVSEARVFACAVGMDDEVVRVLVLARFKLNPNLAG
jgi:hypothetical protein